MRRGTSSAIVGNGGYVGPPAADAAVSRFVSIGRRRHRQRAHAVAAACDRALNAVFRARPGSGLAGARTHDVEVVAREPRRLTPGVTPFFSMEQRARPRHSRASLRGDRAAISASPRGRCPRDCSLRRLPIRLLHLPQCAIGRGRKFLCHSHTVICGFPPRLAPRPR